MKLFNANNQIKRLEKKTKQKFLAVVVEHLIVRDNNKLYYIFYYFISAVIISFRIIIKHFLNKIASSIVVMGVAKCRELLRHPFTV